MQRILLISLTVALLVPGAALAVPVYSFETLWSKIKHASYEISESTNDLKAAEKAYQRSTRHFLPEVSLKASAYSTNNPGLSFFSNLGQRSINALDFNPSNLNHPGFSEYGQATLLTTMPLYSGGLKVATKQALAHMRDAKKYGGSFTETLVYTNTAAEYALLLSAQRHGGYLAALDTELKALLNEYELGSKNNPVGHSGLLGLKSLSNRIRGMSLQAETRVKSLKVSLSERADLGGSGWGIQSEPVGGFLRRKFGRPVRSDDTREETPASVKSLTQAAGALQKFSDAEKAKFLPHVGVFGEANAFTGARDTSGAATLGAYMQWNIFAPTEYGSVKEKKHQAAALKDKAHAAKLNAQIDAEQSHQSILMAHENINLMHDSLALLKEQSLTAKGLYRNGAINILQMVELINRRADLLFQLYQTEELLVAESARNYLQGGKHDQ
ncbi:MAG: TolC family protein [Deltaproteobacteria bacterium]|nr:TolC family protein [Deltaproteobacteria bacterium]